MIQSRIASLSDRELEVFRLIGQGRATREIAEELHLSVKTVETYYAHIKEKLALRSGRELIQHAIQWKINEKDCLIRLQARLVTIFVTSLHRGIPYPPLAESTTSE